MEPTRSFSMTRSQVSAFELGCITSSLSRASPAVRSFSLWQVTQYWSRTAPGGGSFCGAAVSTLDMARTIETATTTATIDSRRIRVLPRKSVKSCLDILPAKRRHTQRKGAYDNAKQGGLGCTRDLIDSDNTFGSGGSASAGSLRSEE